ncbi:unnamed protein product, partial [Amoebophrya sp. A120]
SVQNTKRVLTLLLSCSTLRTTSSDFIRNSIVLRKKSKTGTRVMLYSNGCFTGNSRMLLLRKMKLFHQIGLLLQLSSAAQARFLSGKTS